MIRNMSWKVKGSIVIGVFIAALYGAATGLNHLKTDSYEKNQNYFSITRARGVLDSDTFRRYNYAGFESDEVFTMRLLGPDNVIIDGSPFGKRDGLADLVRVEEACLLCDCKKELLRKDDYSANKEEFHKADRELAKAKRKFSSYL